MIRFCSGIRQRKVMCFCDFWPSQLTDSSPSSWWQSHTSSDPERNSQGPKVQNGMVQADMMLFFQDGFSVLFSGTTVYLFDFVASWIGSTMVLTFSRQGATSSKVTVDFLTWQRKVTTLLLETTLGPMEKQKNKIKVKLQYPVVRNEIILNHIESIPSYTKDKQTICYRSLFNDF